MKSQKDVLDLLLTSEPTTERGVLYGPSEGHGDDPIANKDDEFAVGPWCKVDDNFGEHPGNEWSGAWDFTDDTSVVEERTVTVADGTEGHYIFEFSRPLTTSSPETDVQLKPGIELGFGVGFWDPFETDDGWTDSGHVVTGCSKDWIALRLVDENGDATPVYDEETDVAASDASTTDAPPVGSVTGTIQAHSSAISVVAGTVFSIFAAVVANCVVFETIICA